MRPFEWIEDDFDERDPLDLWEPSALWRKPVDNFIAELA